MKFISNLLTLSYIENFLDALNNHYSMQTSPACLKRTHLELWTILSDECQTKTQLRQQKASGVVQQLSLVSSDVLQLFSFGST